MYEEKYEDRAARRGVAIQFEFNLAFQSRRIMMMTNVERKKYDERAQKSA